MDASSVRGSSWMGAAAGSAGDKLAGAEAFQGNPCRGQTYNHWRGALDAFLGGLLCIAEEHSGRAGGDAQGDVASEGCVQRGVCAGHGEFALQQPRQKGIGSGPGGPCEVVGAEKPE